MKVVGIDPGLERVGYAVIDHTNTQDKLVESGLIKTSPLKTKGERLDLIYRQLLEVLERATPSLAGVETLYFTVNSKSAMSVAEDRGVILVLLAQKHIPTIEPTPLQVKVALTGYGKADKTQVSGMVKKILRFKEDLGPDDVYDAVAIALASAALNMSAAMR